MTASSLGGLLLDTTDTTGTTPHVAGGFDGEHVLVPLLTEEGAVVTDQLKVATALARVTDASLSVVRRTGTGDRTRGRGIRRREVTDLDDAPLEWALDRTVDAPSQSGGGLLTTSDLVAGVRRAVSADDVDTVVLPSGSDAGRLRTGIVDRIGALADCDTLVVNGQGSYGTVASILLPIAGGPHSGLAADFARSIAADTDAWIDVLHVVDEDASDRQRDAADELVEDAYHRIARPETTTTWVLEADDPAEAIVEKSRCYDLTIIGAPTKGRLRRFIHGSTNRSVRENARSVVLSARNNG